MGKFWLGKFAKYMIYREFCHFEGSKPVRFSHSDFGFVIEALENAAGERLFGSELVE